MKKIFLSLIATIMTFGAASAQDLNEAITLAKDGYAAFELGEYNLAVEAFTKAISIAEAIEGEEAANHANTCKTAICNVYYNNAKALLKARDYDGALAKLNETVSAAEKYGAEKTLANAQALIPNVYVALGKSAFKAKDVAGAIAAYNKAIEHCPTNGEAYLNLGQALAASGKIEEAVAAYETAAANGEDKDAEKRLSTLFLKIAQTSMKAGKSQEALENALKSVSYLESDKAYETAGKAALKIGKNQQSIEYFEKVLELSPNAKNANEIKYQIAIAAQESGSKDKAIEYFQMIVNDPNFAEYAKHQIGELSK